MRARAWLVHDDQMSDRWIVRDSITHAATKLEHAHHALGRMCASRTVEELAAAARELLVATRGVSTLMTEVWVEQSTGANRTRSEREFSAWFVELIAPVSRHPLESETTGPPLGAPLRVARGSSPPPFRPDDFYFDGIDGQPALALCAEYLASVGEVLDRAKQELRRRGL